MAQKRSAWPPRVVRSASKLTLPEARTRRFDGVDLADEL
jgi:hypothetical protein